MDSTRENLVNSPNASKVMTNEISSEIIKVEPVEPEQPIVITNEASSVALKVEQVESEQQIVIPWNYDKPEDITSQMLSPNASKVVKNE